MQTRNLIYLSWSLAWSCLILGAPGAKAAANPTALQLVKQGDRYVGEASKDHIVQIRSEKSVGTPAPQIWYLVYYDPAATLKAVEVKFVAGQMESVKRPLRLLEPISGGDLPLNMASLKVDSDQALRTATKEPLLENVKVTASQMKLERVGHDGVFGRDGPGEAVWKIKLWASKASDASQPAEVGEVWVSATTNKKVKTDLRLNRLE